MDKTTKTISLGYVVANLDEWLSPEGAEGAYVFNLHAYGPNDTLWLSVYRSDDEGRPVGEALRVYKLQEVLR